MCGLKNTWAEEAFVIALSFRSLEMLMQFAFAQAENLQ